MNEALRRALADAMRPLVDLVYKIEAKLAGKPHFEWGTVTQTSPLRVRLDTHYTVLPDTPATLVAGLREGNRVRVERQGTRAVIHGVGGGNVHTPFAVATGRAVITPVANSPTPVTVAFPVGRFTETPRISLTPNAGGTAVLTNGGVGYTSASQSSVTINLVRSNTSDTGVDWVAVQMEE